MLTSEREKEGVKIEIF